MVDYNKLAKRGLAEGVGVTFVIMAIRTLDKKLAAAITMRSAAVLIGSIFIANVGIEYLEKEGYL